MSLTSDWLVMI